MSPIGSFTGNRNSRLLIELGNWNDNSGLGYVSWISKERWEAILLEKQEKFAPICPEFIVELRSPNDELKYFTER